MSLIWRWCDGEVFLAGSAGKFRAAYRSYQRVLHPASPTVANSVRKLCHDLALDQQAS